VLNSVVCCRKIKTRVRPVDNLLSGAPIRRGRVRPVFRRERSRAFFFCRNSGGGGRQTRQHCRPTDRHGWLMDGVGVRRRRRQQQQRRRSTEVLCFGRMLSSARRPSSHTNYCYGRPARRGSAAAADVTVHLCRRYIGTFVLPTGRLPHVYIYIFMCIYHTRGTGNNDIMYISRLVLGTPTHPHTSVVRNRRHL